MEIKAVIWDMGGVIVRTEDQAPRRRLAERYGLSPEELSKLVFGNESGSFATVGRISEEEHWAAIGAQLKINSAALTHFRREFWAGDRIDRDLLKFIASLNGKYKTGLLSNAWTGARQILTEYYKCMDNFQFSVFSAEVGLAKPDPGIYHHILQLMEVAPAEAIFVDDFEENIIAANLLGIHGVHFRSAEQARQEVEQLLGL